MRAEQQHPAATSDSRRRWPGLGDAASGAEQCTPADAAEPKRAEQPLSLRYTAISDLDAYLDVTGGWTPEQCFEVQCSDCPEPAAPGKTRCQRCIDEKLPQNYQQLRERFPDLPVRRPNEARRFA